MCVKERECVCVCVCVCVCNVCVFIWVHVYVYVCLCVYVCGRLPVSRDSVKEGCRAAKWTPHEFCGRGRRGEERWGKRVGGHRRGEIEEKQIKEEKGLKRQG